MVIVYTDGHHLSILSLHMKQSIYFGTYFPWENEITVGKV